MNILVLKLPVMEHKLLITLFLDFHYSQFGKEMVMELKEQIHKFIGLDLEHSKVL